GCLILLSTDIFRTYKLVHVVNLEFSTIFFPSARQLLEVYKKHEPFDIFVENNAYQHTLAEWMEEIEGGRELPIEGYYTGSQKLDLA
ncbi:unnamed protein product, partial [marine sediment metagenome]